MTKEKNKTSKKAPKAPKEKKLLGGSKYSTSKKKRQKTAKPSKDPVMAKKDSALKIKIKNLQKEIKRIQNSDQFDSKVLKDLDDKLEKLLKISKEKLKEKKKLEALKETKKPVEKASE